MIDNLKPYPECQDSGHPWIGVIPCHWNLLPNRAIFEEVKDRNHPNEEMLSVTITRGIIKQQSLLENSSKKDSSNQDKSAYKLVSPRDIAYNKMRAWQGAIGASSFRGIISPAYVVMRLRGNDDPWYFHHLYRTPHFAKEAERWSYGITSDMWSLRPEHFKMIYTPVPPPDEQAAIVRFLNHANLRIEKAIRAKRKVIALLNEQKQVIIHHAATRGLDPNVRLKPSGISWLGDIPEHWDVRPVKQLLSSMDYGTSESIRGDGRIRVLTMGNIRDGKIALPKEGGLTSIPKGLLLETNDLLFNRTNSPDLVGKVGLFTGDATDEITFASYLVRLRARLEHSPQWLNLILNSTQFWAYARSQALVSLHQANLNSKRYGQMLIPVPPHDEQQEIFKVVSIQTKDIEIAISHAEREIDLLREYRTRLISDVVTGKLDVREAAELLPKDDGVAGSNELVTDDDEFTEEDEL